MDTQPNHAHPLKWSSAVRKASAISVFSLGVTLAADGGQATGSTALAAGAALPAVTTGVQRPCDAWNMQAGPASDLTGYGNANYPEASDTTYWGTILEAPIGSTLTIHGRYPAARHMSLDIYSGDKLIDHINDVDILPDPGENNPFVSGVSHGTYTVTLVFGDRPPNPPPNTLYTGGRRLAPLAYRIYHTNDPADPAAAVGEPVLPILTLNGSTLTSCPVLPFLEEDVTPWGRLDNADWIGTPPTPRQRRAFQVVNPPAWAIAAPYDSHYYPNAANYYMGAGLSRQFLRPYTKNELYVVRFKAPTFPNTRKAEPVYSDRQVRFWSMCTDEPYTTNVVRCVPDDKALLDADGYASFVVSDPGAKPSDDALAMHRANWIAWGALNLPEDVVHDRMGRAWGIDSPVHFYNLLLYRQTEASATFTQSFRAVSDLPLDQQQAAMGKYWPIGGYCTTAGFNALGFGCVGR
jgi:hypothetical protein